MESRCLISSTFKLLHTLICKVWNLLLYKDSYYQHLLFHIVLIKKKAQSWEWRHLRSIFSFGHKQLYYPRRVNFNFIFCMSVFSLMVTECSIRLLFIQQIIIECILCVRSHTRWGTVLRVAGGHSNQSFLSRHFP